MIRDTAVDLLMGRLGKRVSTTTQQDIINEMVYVQENILEGDPTIPWFLLTEKATASTTPDEERLALPSDFLQEWEEGALYIIDSAGETKPVIKDDWDSVKHKVTGSGRPTHYSLAGDYFLLRKVPDAVYSIHMRYYARQTSLAGSYGSSDPGNVENNWLKWAGDWFIAEVGIIISRQYLQSKEMLELFVAQRATAKKRIVDKDTIMKETNVQRFMEG